MSFSWGNYKKDISCLQRCCPCKDAPTFWSVNWTAALMHLVNTLLTLILWSVDDNKDNQYSLSETAAPWYNISDSGNCTDNLPENGNFPIQVSDEFCIYRIENITSHLSLWWLVIAFHFLSFVFQALSMAEWTIPCCGFRCIRENYIKEVDSYGTNVLRMVEYSVSATLMQIAIALVLGIWNRSVIVGVAFLTAVTMLLGLIAEQLRYDRKDMAWTAHFTGWLSLGGVWFIIGRQFLYTLEVSETKPPDFVYIVVIVIAILYCGFGLIQFFQLYCSPKTNSSAFNRKIEMAYTINSLTSKTFLGWIIFANALTGMSQS
tara:strand:+ start:218 stop:1171 length:954 start_codon:yes stop_codon:yes gene_type:complete